jgi:F-type H+-transporting ATPase subunit b
MANHPEAAGNFLVPNGTFIAEVIAFLLILAVLYRYVVPIVQKAMRERQAMISRQVEESEEASRRLAEAQQRYREALNEARNEAAEIRETARADAQRTVDELRAQAREESARIVARGEEQLARQRDAIVRELREEIGTLAVELAEKIIDQRLSSDARVRATVDSFIAGLEAQDRATETARAGS